MGFFSQFLGPIAGLALPAIELLGRDQQDLGQLNASTDLQARIARALTQPNLGEFSGLLESEMGNIGKSDASFLRNMRIEGDRQFARTGFRTQDAGRRDERISNMALQQHETARERARTTVRSYLTAAAGANNIQGFAAAAQVGAQQTAQRNDRRAGLFELGLGGIARADQFGDAFKGLLDGTPTRQGQSNPDIQLA